MALFGKNMTVRKSKYLVTLYLYDLLQPSDKKFLGGKLNLIESLKNTHESLEKRHALDLRTVDQ